jgi:hypothetical protein
MTAPTKEPKLICPNCGFPLERSYWNQPLLQPCSRCQTNVRLLVFPVAVEPAQVPAPNLNAAQGEATCFYHSNKQAHVPCASCGRFLCTVCDIYFRGEHWCPSCMKLQADTQTRPEFQRGVMRFDSLALILVTIPAIVIYPTLLTAPIALFLSIRHWNDPNGFLPRTNIRKYLAVFFSVSQIVGWIALFTFLFFNFTKMFPRGMR